MKPKLLEQHLPNKRTKTKHLCKLTVNALAVV